MIQREAANLQEHERVHIGAFVPRELADRLTKRAREQDRSVSSLIRRAVTVELEHESDVSG